MKPKATTCWNVYCDGRLTGTLTTPDDYTAERVRTDLGDIAGVTVTRRGDVERQYHHETIEADRFVAMTEVR